MAVQTPDGDPQPKRDAYTWEQMRETGLLWLINRVVFHPRGFALALDYAKGEDTPRGWSITGDGSEVWVFPSDKFDEDDFLRRIENVLDEAKKFGRSPKLDTVEPEAAITETVDIPETSVPV